MHYDVHFSPFGLRRGRIKRSVTRALLFWYESCATIVGPPTQVNIGRASHIFDQC
jgi:hypothetical protein